MSIVVAIHNAVNERTWLELRRWELTLHPECAQGPKLVSIKGLSSHPSPKGNEKKGGSFYFCMMYRFNNSLFSFVIKLAFGVLLVAVSLLIVTIG